MISKFHQLIQKGRISAAIDILIKDDIDENLFISLTLIKMKLAIIEQAINNGRIKNLESELHLKNDLVFRLLKIHNDLKS